LASKSSANAPTITKTVVTEEGKTAKSLPAWNVPEMETSALAISRLAKSVKYLRGDKNIFNFGQHLGLYTKEDGSIDIAKLPDTWESGGVSYTKAELQATFDKLALGLPVTTI